MNIEKKLLRMRNYQTKKIMESFFKYKPNYILGIRVPILRNLSKKYNDISLVDIDYLLRSDYHECRIIALILLIKLYDRSCAKKYVNFYLKHLKWINNWDLVDLSAHRILGHYLYNLDRQTAKRFLLKLSKSKNMWHRRIAVISVRYFITNDSLNIPLNIFKYLITDSEYYIQTAVGWMLREIGKKNELLLIKFLKKYYKIMPSVIYSYATEKIDTTTKKIISG